MTAPALDDLNLLAAYLARRDVDTGAALRADVVVLCGSAVLAAVDTAADAAQRQHTPRVLVTGGRGHSTSYLVEAVRADPRYGDVPTEGRSEAAILADILRAHHGLPEEALLVEERSSNCGENAEFSVEILRRLAPPVRSVLLIQDPTMQRRTHASFERFLRRATLDATVRSCPPFVPVVADGSVGGPDGAAVWSVHRFTGLVLGELRRLTDDADGYGPRGADFLDHIDIPTAVVDAYGRAAAAHPGSSREPWRGGHEDGSG